MTRRDRYAQQVLEAPTVELYEEHEDDGGDETRDQGDDEEAGAEFLRKQAKVRHYRSTDDARQEVLALSA